MPELLERFNRTHVFWEQFDVAESLSAAGDARILPDLESWLSHDDRQLRGNAAFIFAKLGDRRGFEVIVAILSDNSPRSASRGIVNGPLSQSGQVTQDRYYAVHLLGELKDQRAIDVLEPLMSDDGVNYNIAWALGEIGGPSAVRVLIAALSNRSPDVRVIAVHLLAKLDAKDALPSLRRLLSDQEKCHFGASQSVADAAREALAKLE